MASHCVAFKYVKNVLIFIIELNNLQQIFRIQNKLLKQKKQCIGIILINFLAKLFDNMLNVIIKHYVKYYLQIQYLFILIFGIMSYAIHSDLYRLSRFISTKQPNNQSTLRRYGPSGNRFCPALHEPTHRFFLSISILFL